MAKIDPEILNAALRLGLFKVPLTADQKKCVHRSIIKASQFIDYVNTQEDLGADILAVADHLQNHPNTIIIYARWLIKNRLIGFEILPESGGPIIYFPTN